MARPVSGPREQAMPLAVQRLMARARAEGAVPPSALVQGWMVEPVARPTQPLWVWGPDMSGGRSWRSWHRCPGSAITWVDVAADAVSRCDVPAGRDRARLRRTRQLLVSPYACTGPSIWC